MEQRWKKVKRMNESIDKSHVVKIPQFNIGDEVRMKSSGIKLIVTYQNGTDVSCWWTRKRVNSFGSPYYPIYNQQLNAYEIEKTGKKYPEIARALKELCE